MDFRDSARLDTSQVCDVRGRRGGGGRGMAIGGGGLGIVGLLIALVLGVNPADLGGGGESLGTGTGTGSTSTSDLDERCRTGADADRDEDCRVVGVVNSVQAYWAETVRGLPAGADRAVQRLDDHRLRLGHLGGRPVLLPAGHGHLPRPAFFEVLRTQYGASGGDFAQAYVIAHEYGHHVQNLTGQSERSRQLPDQTGPQGASTRLELQADCYAGVWAANAVDTGYLTIDDADIDEGLSAAAAVGDDRIQEKAQGRVDPESWTHGSAEQRQTWFRTGLSSGDPNSCDTFSGSV